MTNTKRHLQLSHRPGRRTHNREAGEHAPGNYEKVLAAIYVAELGKSNSEACMISRISKPWTRPCQNGPHRLTHVRQEIAQYRPSRVLRVSDIDRDGDQGRGDNRGVETGKHESRENAVYHPEVNDKTTQT